jgi:carbon-monoxide dehydrogenase small subunit
MNQKKMLMRFSVNGVDVEIAAPSNRLLIDVLREDLSLTGTKLGCDDGSCGACTILVNDVPVQCCMMLAVSYQGKKITTIEGVDQRGVLDPLQKAFCDQGGQQCGFCTPGMILSAKALLEAHPDPTVADISKAIAGNLCRCTGYTKIIAAVQQAAGDYRKLKQIPERIAK